MDDNRNLDLKEVTHVWGLAEADVIKSYLESNGIPCVYQTLVTPFVHVFTTDGMGEIKIMVKAEDMETAHALLDKTDVAPEEGREPEKSE
ncbi:MAG: DUF2007 domain-containing protein [Acidobacteriota bacterium]|nr:DUF2007 domain-containing protein [Acidobacteriota bacterium]